jgi:protein SCO1/2
MPTRNRNRLVSPGLSWFAIVLLLAAGAQAQRTEPAPKELDDVGITPQPGVQVPLDLSFVDSGGKPVRLGDFCDGKRPVLLTLNYSNCPMLCSLQLNGLFGALGDMPWVLGENFQMLTVSIDPLETPARAQLTKQKYLKMYGRPAGSGGWHVLTGKEQDIRKLANTIGFHYRYIKETGEYAHAAAAFVLTPDGRVSRYLYGVEYDPQTIRLSLVEASEGKVGSAMDQVLLICFHYDATKGRYGPAAQGVMRAAALLTVVGLGCMVLVFWRRGKARFHRQAGDRHEEAMVASGEKATEVGG